MRSLVAVACLFSMTLTGCATRPALVVPAGVDRAELSAAIARQGAPPQSGEQPGQPRPLSKADKMGRKVMVYGAIAGACVAILAVGVGLGYLESRIDPHNHQSSDL